MANSKKGLNILLLDLSQLSSYTDYLVICSGTSDRQVQAITDSMIKALKDKGEKRPRVEGYDQGHWVLIDCGDVVVHVFYEAVRHAYDLETLWLDAPKTNYPLKKKATVKKKVAALGR